MAIGVRISMVGVSMDGGDYRVVGIGKTMAIAIVSISLRGSLSSSSGLSLSLAIVVSMAIGVRVSMVGVSMDGGDYRVVGVGKTMAIAIVGISLWLGLSRPLTVVAMVKAMSIVTMSIDMTEVAIAIS